jgi:hypothetical protein
MNTKDMAREEKQLSSEFCFSLFEDNTSKISLAYYAVILLIFSAGTGVMCAR